MELMGRKEGAQKAAKVHRSFRLIVILLFAILGAFAFGSFAVPVLNGLSGGLTRMLSPQLNSSTAAVKLRQKNNRVQVVSGALSAQAPPTYTSTPLNVMPFALLGALLGGFAGVLFLNGLERAVGVWDRMELGDRVNAFIGTFAGIFVALQFLTLFQNLDIPPPMRASILLVLMVGFAALAIYSLQSISEVLPWSKMRGKTRRSGIKVMDTNVIIDGRIYDIAKTGFLDGQLYVPGFVLDELQFIADSHDQLRRQRGRRGLEVLKHMQADFPMEVRVHDKLAPDLGDGVDSRLVRLAKALGGDILTNDFNLKRVAELQEVQVLSLNDLALALRPNVLPLESLCGLKIIKEGNQFGQGVGYLDDGTMVVVENGQSHIGETLDVTVTQVIQTERGKMIFAEVSGDETADPRNNRRRRT